MADKSDKERGYQSAHQQARDVQGRLTTTLLVHYGLALGTVTISFRFIFGIIFWEPGMKTLYSAQYQHGAATSRSKHYSETNIVPTLPTAASSTNSKWCRNIGHSETAAKRGPRHGRARKEMLMLAVSTMTAMNTDGRSNNGCGLKHPSSNKLLGRC